MSWIIGCIYIYNTWIPKQPFVNGCFNWMISNLYIGKGCFTKHPFKTGCLGFQVYIPRTWLTSFWEGWPAPLYGSNLPKYGPFGSRYVYAWNPNDSPNDPCFDWKRPSFGGLKPQNRGQTGSRCIYYIILLCISLYICQRTLRPIRATPVGVYDLFLFAKLFSSYDRTSIS